MAQIENKSRGRSVTARRNDWILRIAVDPNLKTAVPLANVLALGFDNDMKGFSWPSLETLIAALGVSKNTVGRATDLLEESRFLIVRKGGGRENSNEYTMAVEGDPGWQVQPSRTVIAEAMDRDKKSRARKKKLSKKGGDWRLKNFSKNGEGSNTKNRPKNRNVMKPIGVHTDNAKPLHFCKDTSPKLEQEGNYEGTERHGVLPKGSSPVPLSGSVYAVNGARKLCESDCILMDQMTIGFIDELDHHSARLEARSGGQSQLDP